MPLLGFGPAIMVAAPSHLRVPVGGFSPYGLLEPQDATDSVPANRSLLQLKMITADSLAQRCFSAILNETNLGGVGWAQAGGIVRQRLVALQRHSFAH